jgi:hypothetical protein
MYLVLTFFMLVNWLVVFFVTSYQGLDLVICYKHTLTNVSLGQIVEAVLSLEQKVVSTAALSDAERFSQIPYFMEGSSSANDGHHAVAGNKVLCSVQSDHHVAMRWCHAITTVKCKC